MVFQFESDILIYILFVYKVLIELWIDLCCVLASCADGLAVEVDEQHMISESNTGSCCLVLTGVGLEDSGQYMCYASNCMGNASTLAKVVVDGKF